MSSGRAFCFSGQRCVVKQANDIIMQPIGISHRQKSRGANHHLWNNNGTWWLHCTIHLPDHTKWRLRKNLRTADVHTARQLRDRILADNSTAFAA
jgi:hypothetical protein